MEKYSASSGFEDETEGVNSLFDNADGVPFPDGDGVTFADEVERFWSWDCKFWERGLALFFRYSDRKVSKISSINEKKQTL